MIRESCHGCLSVNLPHGRIVVPRLIIGIYSYSGYLRSQWAMRIMGLWRRWADAVVVLHIANRSPNLCICCHVVRYYGVTALANDLSI